jgi:glutamate-1-semialdehyde aminotransferase
MKDYVEPDFYAWAAYLYVHDSKQEIRRALQQAFEQGRALGKREKQSMEIAEWKPL